MSQPPASPRSEHAFVKAPNATLLKYSGWVFLAIVAEPVTGLVDTAFVRGLGAAPLAALGVGTVVLTSIFWVFNFLGIGTQTEVGKHLGAGDAGRSNQLWSLAITLALLLGAGILVLVSLLAPVPAEAMGADGEVRTGSITYLGIRGLAAPAILLTIASFGVLRGLQDMRTPTAIAVGVNLLNIALDPILIYGWGPVPRLEIAGAAWATTVSQWLGALCALGVVYRRLGMPERWQARDAVRLLSVGRDLFLRTGLLTLFMVLTTRSATLMGEDHAAAHQAVRSVWLLTAFVLDAFAITAQTLVSFFLGAGDVLQARRVSAFAAVWSVGTGILLCLVMFAGASQVQAVLVPETAAALFGSAWLLAALSQPINAISFATDGIHWGTADYGYLRNTMILATTGGGIAVLILDRSGDPNLAALWSITAGWIGVRALFGFLRIWPGIGRAPLASRDEG